MKLLLSQSQPKNTSVTNHVRKVTNVYAVLKTNAYYINMVECVNVYYLGVVELKEAKTRTTPFSNVCPMVY